jgi:translocation and assembly module TamB
VLGEVPTAILKLSGKNFQVVDTYEARVFVSPELTFELAEEHVDLTGVVVIPTAEITPKKVPETAVGVSADQVIVRPEAEGQPQRPRRIHANVRIVLGDDVRFEGFGLKARLAGNIVAIEEPGQVTKGSGQLAIVEGRYKAYGQDLDIEKGRVLFAGGPITEPGLDVRAVRRPVEGVVVGVKVRGSPKEPDFALFSEPSMTQAEQLSYLILGRAGLALGLGGGGAVAKSLGKELGLDEVGIESGPSTTGTDQASLVVGKYLSPKVFVSYGIGIFEPISTVRLRYSISSRWKLITESSAVGSGADLFYTVERGK